ncbi:MAG TPA: ComEC/Rec2 family competence protein [Gaiellaceae bacterium]
MTKVLPAHLTAGAAVGGLALSNALRVSLAPSLLAAVLCGLAALALAAPHPARLAVVIALVAGAGWWWGSARLSALDRSPLRARVDEADWFDVTVTSEPRVGRFDQRLFGRARRFGALRLDERVELELPLGRAPPQGARIRALAVVRLPLAPPAGGGFDERLWLRRQGIHVVLHVDEWRAVGRRGGIGGAGDRLRAWLRRASAPGVTGERRAVIEGIVLGDDQGLSPGLKNAFRRSGLYHLLAVSGQNVVLIAVGMLGLALLLGLPRAAGHLGALAAIGAYVLAVGPQPSVVRAAVAGGAVSIAWLAGRQRDGWHVLLLAAVVLLAWSPYALFDPGFQLSFAAVVAIFVLAPRLVERLEGYPLPGSLRTTAGISAACGIATAPVLALRFGAVPVLGIVANALVEPVVGVLLGLALVAAAVDPVAPGLAAGLAWLDGWIAAYVATCARMVAAVPFAQLHGAAAAVATVVPLLVIAAAWRRWRGRES